LAGAQYVCVMNYPLAMQRVMDTSSLCWVRKFNPLFQEAKLEFELVPLSFGPDARHRFHHHAGTTAPRC